MFKHWSVKRKAKHAQKKAKKVSADEKTKVRKRLDKTDWLKVLNRIEEHKSYYVGGGLFVDMPEGCFGIHLSGRVTEFATGVTRPLSKRAHRKAFEVYRQYKGETCFYRTNLDLCPEE